MGAAALRLSCPSCLSCLGSDLEGTLANCVPHEIASEPPASLMSTNSHVNCSLVCGAFELHRRAHDILVRRIPYEPHSASLLVRLVAGSRFSARERGHDERQLFSLRSMKRLYSPGAIVLPLMTSGTSVFKRVETFAPARQIGAPTSVAFP